jgi:hypothetical protein
MGTASGEWAQWAMSQGYDIVCDTRFAVRHSHKLGSKELKKQLEYWFQLGKPGKFNRDKLSFRKDLDFREKS